MAQPGNTAPTVAVTRCDGYEPHKVRQALERQFSLLGGVDKFVSSGERVLLKPNFIIPRGRALAAQTDPAVILAVARIVKDCGAKPFIGDSPAWGSISGCIRALGLAEGLKKLGVGFEQLNRPRKFEIAGSNIGISTVALEADKIINLPKLKTHQQLGATFAVKNMFGCVSGKEKAYRHFTKGRNHEDFCEMLIGIFELLGPVVTIIDAVVAMEGQGPISGKPRDLGFIVGGIDPIACELLCCELVNFNADKLPIIQTARRLKFGCPDLSRVNIVGDDYTDLVCNDFVHADQTPLHFSFGRVCQSAAKQLYLLFKAVAGSLKKG
jgi:uncharacterized protein (DUF362 family)